MACHRPFVFDALMGDSERRISVPAMAAKVVAPGSLAADGSPQELKKYTSKQLAKAVQGSKCYRSASSDTNNM
eukprot:9592803-Heterocapsa_arctica.AAC.1